MRVCTATRLKSVTCPSLGLVFDLRNQNSRTALSGHCSHFVPFACANRCCSSVIYFAASISHVSAKLHYTDTGYGHVVQQRLRTSSQQFYNLWYNEFAPSQCQSPTSRHVKMLGCGKFLSVGGEFVVQQVVELL